MITGVGVGPAGVGVVGGKSPPGTSTPQATNTNNNAAMMTKGAYLIG
jgi:hypothetical protein